ncbi:YkgJ family cysteine cluster protein [Acidaminobacter sp. JC074]|uniref:YkgJ family cysteine cluster protein n=1 Tax=Acidaminobacter sp. JC074 TaxID=2530199 RepID=UPI001F0EB503|nr:YkgJ family cysteine cluster protein [Acidaminobacter sp. JC074]MCH4887321.1 YkgJ family cysteine cluster protein [Acidaminobacter sp. JC074]
MEITKKMIEKSNVLLKNNNLISNLNDIYSEIPSGKCNGCAKCCVESVHAFYVEFLNIYKYVQDKGMYETIMKRIEDHYFNELVVKQACPFLTTENTCMIYEVRPYVCRLFGHSTRQEHEANYQNILEQNLEADAYFFETYGVHLSQEVIYHKINFCQAFKAEKPISQNEKLNLIDRLFMLDTQFLMADILPEEMLNMSITNWFIYTKYSEDQAGEMRINQLLNGK